MNLHKLICLLIVAQGSAAYRILGIFPFNGKSHHIVFSVFLEELAERGHNVTAINYFPLKKKDNLRQISLQTNSSADLIIDVQEMYANMPRYFRDFFIAKGMAELFEIFADVNCQKMVEHPEILELIKNSEFDLVIVEQFATDCGLALAHHFKCPSIGISCSTLSPWHYSRFGIPYHPAFTPNRFISTGSQPDFWGRIKSALTALYLNVYHRHVTQQKDLETVRRILTDTPDLETIAGNMSLVLTNTYYPYTSSRLRADNVIEVGGMHIKSTDKMDKDIADFMAGAEHGVVYISMGTVTKSTSFPKEAMEGMLGFIRKSKQRFIWKREEANFIDMPKNLMIKKWLPQLAILCHENVVGFISHSGMSSSVEATHCGVPVVNVPLFGDQFANAASARESGMGVTVDYDQIDEAHLIEALATILQPEYKERVKRLSAIWRDRPSRALDTAVYWSEFVARHGAAPHLASPVAALPLARLLLLDLLAPALLLLWLAGRVARLALCYCVERVCGCDAVGERKIKTH